jgi:hypothetical protein
MHGALVGVLGIGVGIVLVLPFLASFPLWYHITSFAGIIPVAMLGGGLASLARPVLPEKR